MTYHPDAESLVRVCDVVTINAPLHPETEHLFDDALIAKMKRGAYIVNTARGRICDRDAIARALESGQFAGYAGDVWFPQPAPGMIPGGRCPTTGCTTRVGVVSVRASPLCGRSARDPGVLFRWSPDTRGIPDRRSRYASGRRRSFVQRRRRHPRLRRRSTLQASLARRAAARPLSPPVHPHTERANGCGSPCGARRLPGIETVSLSIERIRSKEAKSVVPLPSNPN